jgi:hypothetical protein
MNKFDTLVNSILEEGLMSNIKAGLKTAAKAPFRAAGGLAKKAINPAAYLRGAAGVVGAIPKVLGAPGKAIDTAYQMMQTGDISPATGAVQSGLQKAAGGLSKLGQTVAGQYQAQKQTDVQKSTYGTSASIPQGSVNFNLPALQAATRKSGMSVALPRGVTDPNLLKKGDTFSQVDKRTGRAVAYKVLDKSRDNKNLLAVPVAFNK